MSQNSWNQTVPTLLQAAGPTLTAAASASMLVAASPTAGQQRFTFPANAFKIGDHFKYIARGIISCAVTTPGTARFDLRFGAIVVFDTGPLNLNTTAKTNVPWTLDVDLTIRTLGAGTAATLWAQGTWVSEAVVGSPANSAGGNGILNVPVSGITVSNGFSSDTAFLIDSYFTQTVATGSMTAQQARLIFET